jgi:CubicO group peptidase (beta-lactamase class C family)
MARTAIFVLALTTSFATVSVVGQQQLKPQPKPPQTKQPPAPPAKPAPPPQPAQPPMQTRWAGEVSPTNALPEYPRPMLSRQEWLNLNGVWEYAIRPRGEDKPERFDGKILVPYAVESLLSGVRKKVGETNRLWYRRTFEVPPRWRGRRTLLNFGAVDWDATVLVNGREVGTHRGGYDAFTVDITRALIATGPQELVVSVWDPTDTGAQPRGKQVSKPGGIWYTSVTGIWQTVWLEPVPDSAIDALTVVPDVDTSSITITAGVPGATADLRITAIAIADNRPIAQVEGVPGRPFALRLTNPALWSPDSPTLYDLQISLTRGNKLVDRVWSYFGMRKTSLCKDREGIQRLCLNNKPLFQFGPLDQGWWPDGLYTAPTDDALRFDIQATKQLGFNMARKHVKVEPERWYYWADRLGLLVWQDMPNVSPKANRTSESDEQFEREWKAIIDQRRNHPSIVMWVPFNEGWGQYDTSRITEWTKKYDPTRLVNNASGWTDSGAGDVNDIHRYPGPGAPKVEEARAAVLGEFGGLGMPVPNHTWQSQANWSYRGYANKDALTDGYVALVGRLHPLLGSPGLAAAVYTQTTDVEIEVNGLLTYDRARVKIDETRMREANRALFTRPPVVQPLVPIARDTPSTWRYVTWQPASGWNTPGFDDVSWLSGPGGFGTASTPGAAMGTVWNTNEIWLRRTFELPEGAAWVNPHLMLHHDEDAEVFINGVLAAKLSGFTTDYELTAISADARATLKAGRNTIAIHCRQTTGGQFIDAGLVDVAPPSKNAELKAGFQDKLDELRQRAGFPGVTVSIAFDDGLTLDGASGSAASAGPPLSTSSRMPAAGVGKTFIAAAILQAVDEGVLDLDTPIEKWLGRQLWFPRLPNAHALTLRLLLSHRSGIPDVSSTEPVVRAMTTTAGRRWSSAELVQFVLDQKPVFKPGTRYLYSDMNYVIAGAVFERAANRTLFSEIDRRLLQPLALAHTVPVERRDMTDVVSGQIDTADPRYKLFTPPDTTIRGGGFSYNVQFQHGAGGLISSSRDLAKWATLVWTGKPFSAVSLSEMLGGKPSEGNGRYGLGTQIVPSARGPIYLHDGWIPGYQTTVFRLPDQRLSAAIQVNSDPMKTFTMTPEVLLGQLVSWALKQPR